LIDSNQPVGAELSTKLKLGLETRPPEEQMAAAKAWLAERRTLLVLDDIGSENCQLRGKTKKEGRKSG
jgi:hypothetical protein